MGDPFSIVAGLLTPNLHTTRGLLQKVSNLKNAPSTLRELQDEIDSLEAALESLKRVDRKDWNDLGSVVSDQAMKVLTITTQTFETFSASLGNLTKHSDDELDWRDRTSMVFFKSDKVTTILDQLRNCKLSITQIASIATLYSSVRHNRMTEENWKATYAIQSEIKAASEATNERISSLQKQMEHLRILISDDRKDDDTEVISAMGGKMALNLHQEQHKVREDVNVKVAQGVGDSFVRFGDNNSGFQAYTINGPVTFGAR